MNIRIRNLETGEELGFLADAEHVPGVGEEIVLFASNSVRRSRWVVRRVITEADFTDDWPRRGNQHRPKGIVIEVEGAAES